jgi:catechol 2,3-dioxygenase-like lactoylglutathione lyase family enzyme
MRGEYEMAETKTRTSITEVGRVIVPVSDQERALEFYTGTLGFEKRMDVPYGRGDRWIEVVPAGSTTSLAIVRPPEGMPIGIDTNISLTSVDIDADHAYLQSKGVDEDAEVMRMGSPVPPMFFFRDPDGNRLMIVETE